MVITNQTLLDWSRTTVQSFMWRLVCLLTEWVSGYNSSIDSNSFDQQVFCVHLFNYERTISSSFQQYEPVKLNSRRHFRRIFLALYDPFQKSLMQPTSLNQNPYAKFERCSSILDLDFLRKHWQPEEWVSPIFHQRNPDDLTASDHIWVDRRSIRRRRFT